MTQAVTVQTQIEGYMHFWGFRLSHANINEIADNLKGLEGEALESEMICLVHEKVAENESVIKKI